MFRRVNILDLLAAVCIIIAALTDSPLWWLIALMGLGLLWLSAWGSHLPDERNVGGGNG